MCVSAGVLESPEDFESSEDLYDAVGDMIEGAMGEGEERDIHLLCQQLFSTALGYIHICQSVCVQFVWFCLCKMQN